VCRCLTPSDRNYNLRKRILSTKNDVTAMLSFNFKTQTSLAREHILCQRHAGVKSYRQNYGFKSFFRDR